MAEYLGTVNLGGLYKNGVIQPRPTKPWRISSAPNGQSTAGDIADFSTLTTMSSWVIGNTPTAEANQLKWHKIKDGDKTLLICDRVILVNVSWDDLNGDNRIFGKTITIDGAEYKLRVLTGGNNYRSGSDSYSGGSPATNEWDRFITREEVITGLPAPTSADLDSNLVTADYTSTHGDFWHWAGVYSWCQETCTGNTANRAIRGYNSARYWYCSTASSRGGGDFGWRPVLEVLNTAPLISDTDRNLGDKNADFVINYSVNDADATDVLTVTEYLDGAQIKNFTNAIRGQNYSINVPVTSLSLGTHTVSVTVNDGKGGTATRVWTFQRVNAVPTISGTDQNLGDKNLGFQIEYTVNDTDGDTLTVVEKLNTETLRTINNAPKGETLTLEISNDKLFSLAINSVNTIRIEVSDGKGGTAYRTFTFKRVNAAPSISGVDTDLGQQTGAFSKTYIVNDVEGDEVIVTEKIDDEVIRTYIAQLGVEATITLTEEKWLMLTNGNHALKIEAVDANFATAIRVFNFSKNETEILFEFPAPFETDKMATKILVTPTWNIEGAEAHVYACNNAFDDNPTWEDITAQVFINRVYNFINSEKTATKWGVNIRFHIIKNPGYEGEVSITGFGGAFE